MQCNVRVITYIVRVNGRKVREFPAKGTAELIAARLGGEVFTETRRIRHQLRRVGV